MYIWTGKHYFKQWTQSNRCNDFLISDNYKLHFSSDLGRCIKVDRSVTWRPWICSIPVEVCTFNYTFSDFLDTLYILNTIHNLHSTQLKTKHNYFFLTLYCFVHKKKNTIRYDSLNVITWYGKRLVPTFASLLINKKKKKSFIMTNTVHKHCTNCLPRPSLKAIENLTQLKFNTENFSSVGCQVRNW